MAYFFKRSCIAGNFNVIVFQVHQEKLDQNLMRLEDIGNEFIGASELTGFCTHVCCLNAHDNSLDILTCGAII